MGSGPETQAGRIRAVQPLAHVARLLVGGVAATVAFHLAFCGLYGYQRDELYFIACAKHLAWGYVDQPPLIAVTTRFVLEAFGNSLLALRLLPALAAGALVALTGLLAWRAGGTSFAVGLAMLGVATAPFDLAVGSLLTMNAFEPLFWFALTLLALAQLDSARDWRWPAIGVVVGLGFLNKWSMGLYALALLAGIVATPARRSVLVPGLAVAVAVAATIAAPNLVWQATHGWPQLEVVRQAGALKNERVAAPLFLLEQLPLMNPGCAALWLAGLSALSRSRRFAGLALAYGLLLLAEIALHGKVYYLAPVYPPLIAIGAVAFERITRGRILARAGLAGVIAVTGLAIMPLATPILPLPALLAYQHAVDVRSVKMEHHRAGRIPQQFADQQGWNELVSTVAQTVARLPAGERASAAILTGDYGQAAALNFLGPARGLPLAISGHNQYFLWGPGGEHAALIAVGVPVATLAREYRSVERVTTYASPFVLPENTNLPVFVCRRPRIALVRFWPRLRHYL